MLEARVIGPSTGVIDDKSIVIELILYHVGSEFFHQQRGNFALGHHDNAYRDAKTTSMHTNMEESILEIRYQTRASYMYLVIVKGSQIAWLSSRPCARLTPTQVTNNFCKLNFFFKNLSIQ